MAWRGPLLQAAVLAWPPISAPYSLRRGGCDNCSAQAAGAAAERDLAAEARLLLTVVERLRGYSGLGKPINIVRGSRSKDLAPWMLDMRVAGGAALHGAGAKQSERWWKVHWGSAGRGGCFAWEAAPSASHAAPRRCCLP